MAANGRLSPTAFFVILAAALGGFIAILMGIQGQIPPNALPLPKAASAASSVASSADGSARPASAEGPYPVEYVSDGDTIGVAINGKTITVRMIGIDTPEVKDPRKPVQCFGTEASDRAYELLNNTQVWLEYDPAVDKEDRYGRTLAYVWADQSTLVNQAMLTGGFAHEYTYNHTTYKYQAAFKAAEQTAEASSQGLWNPVTCNGDTTQPAAEVH